MSKHSVVGQVDGMTQMPRLGMARGFDGGASNPCFAYDYATGLRIPGQNCNDPSQGQFTVILVPDQTTGWIDAATADFTVFGGTLTGLGNTNTFTSGDGLTWTNIGQHQMSLDGVTPRDICTGLGILVAITGSGNINTKVYISVDGGVTWTAQTTPIGFGTPGRVAFGNGVFVICQNVTGSNVLTSPDGINWSLTPYNPTNNVNCRDITFANGLFVMVGQESGFGEYITTSPDGSTWTERREGIGGGNLRGVGWTGSYFIAVGNSGRVLTSPTGAVWTQQTFLNSNTLQAAGGGNNIGIVADLTGGVYQSDDGGVTWVLIDTESGGQDGVYVFYDSSITTVLVGY